MRAPLLPACAVDPIPPPRPLQRAEAAPALADREAFAREAVALMMRVPLAVDLGQVVPQLAYLRDFEAVVELPLRVRSWAGVFLSLPLPFFCGCGWGAWVGVLFCFPVSVFGERVPFFWWGGGKAVWDKLMPQPADLRGVGGASDGAAPEGAFLGLGLVWSIEGCPSCPQPVASAAGSRRAALEMPDAP